MAKNKSAPLFTGGNENQSLKPLEEIPPPVSRQDLAPSTLASISRGEKRVRRLELADRFKAAYPDWTAHMPGEMSLALDTLRPQIIELQGKAAGQSFEIIKDTLDKARSYMEEAALACQYLNLAKVLEEDPEPSVRLIRDDPQASNALAEYLLAKQSMASGTWKPRVKRKNPDKPTPREQHKQEIVTRIQTTKTDEQLLADWQEGRKHEQARYEFWDGQIRSLGDIEIVQGIASESAPGP